MATISDETGTYTPRANGKRDYGTTTKVEFNNIVVYDFNPQTGILKIATDQQSIDYIVQGCGGIENMSELTLPFPYGFQAPCRFTGIKSIEPSGETFMNFRPAGLEKKLE